MTITDAEPHMARIIKLAQKDGMTANEICVAAVALSRDIANKSSERMGIVERAEILRTAIVLEILMAVL